MGVLAATDWYVWGAGIALVISLAALVFVAWWALFHDQAGERRRCPRCWYDLKYSPGMTCTECGFAARDESDFKKTRQRRGLATLAILGCTGIGLFMIDRASTRGWMSYVPNRVVIALLPVVSDPRGPVLVDLGRRIKTGELDREHWLDILSRCRDGDASARPPTDEWIDKYGRLVATADQMAVRTDDEAWRDTIHGYLLDIPPRLDLTARRVWPSGVAPTIDVRARSWWPEGTQWRIRATPRLAEARSREHVLLDAPIQRRSYSLPLPALAAGEYDVPLDVLVWRRASDDEAWTALEPREHVVPLVVTDEPSISLEPVTSDQIDDAVRNVFAGGLAKFTRGSLPVRVNVDITQTYSPILEDTAMGIRVEVIRNGRLGRRLDMWWLAGGLIDSRQNAWEVPMHDDEVLGAPTDPDDVWTIRARGDLALALRVEGAKKYWAGDITVDVPVRRTGRPAPPRGWVTWDEADQEPKE